MSEKIGPTGEYPDGKLCADDNGALRLAIYTGDNLVVMAFGVPTKWLAMPPADAIALGNALIANAKKITQ
jgi:hypothetical protein